MTGASTPRGVKASDAPAGSWRDVVLSLRRNTAGLPGECLTRPEVHGAALVAAQAAGKSLNQWAAEVIEGAAHS